ncbi:hypothetical protein [Tellurirhabdus rosea]|uniref:hypothetical protein n=1 Tax=Tellurirhabdus rosea TaxID=2674997 RepID=UPI00225444DC|nr:hypothetical protein [Tellurirhabdus rosea]
MKTTQVCQILLFLLAGIGLFNGCIPKIDPAARFAGVFDCQTTLVESNIIAQSASSRSSYIGKIVLVRVASDKLEVSVEGRPDLTVVAELSGSSLLIRKQIIQIKSVNGYIGPAAALGEGSVDANTVSVNYLASAGSNSYSITVQGRGLRRK